MVELFINYDSEVDRADLCEDMVGLLSQKRVSGLGYLEYYECALLCLDSLLGYIQFIADRLDDEPRYEEGYPDPEKLKNQRQRKGKLLCEARPSLTKTPRLELRILLHRSIIENTDDPELVARFLKGTTRISKEGSW